MRTDQTKGRALLATLAALALTVAIAACGGGDSTTGGPAEAGDAAGPIEPNPDNGKVTLTIGSKESPEQEILGEIYAQALSAAGYEVKSALNLGSETVALKAVKTDHISGYPEYASTALTSFFELDPQEVPADAAEAWEKANKEFEKEGLEAFKPTPFAKANAVGTTDEKAELYELKTLSDLEEGVSERVTLSGPPECRQRIDCLAGLEELYGLRFLAFTSVDIGLRYTVLAKDQADLSIVYTTDPQLSVQSDKYLTLEDDKEVFPAGNVIFVTRKSVAEEAGPDFEGTILQVQEGLTLKVMQELNASVELEKETPKAAAKAYLDEAGYVG